MTRKQSARAAVVAAQREDKRARGAPLAEGVSTFDSFVNFGHRLGVQADNALSAGTYGFNPITRNRVLLEWIHRGSWLGGMAVDIIPDDMTRKGVEFSDEMPPEDAAKLQRKATELGLWDGINKAAKWGRLYGGSIAVMMIDGQDMKTPLRPETVGRDQFKGLIALDRWQVEPSLGDLVTDMGPHIGLPKFYTVLALAPALRGQVIHHSRIAFRFEGVELPYQQRLTENLWGISILERLYDRMLAFDSASLGAAQLVFKAYLRTLKIQNLRQIVAAGGAPMNGVLAYTEMMRRFQGQEGITLLDKEDEFELQQTSAFSSVGDVLLQLGQQLSGALQMPLTRLFGQSPAGLNSTGESDLRTYYDGINQRQEKELRMGVQTCYKLLGQSAGVRIPDDFNMQFVSLWDMNDKEKADTAKTGSDAIAAAFEQGLIGRQTTLKELRQLSRRTGFFTNITQGLINAADDEVMPPLSQQALGRAGFGPDQELPFAEKLGLPGLTGEEEEEDDADAGQNGKKKPVAPGPRRRVDV